MPRIRLLQQIGAMLLLSSLSGVTAMAETLPSGGTVLAKMRLVNDRFLLKWPDPAADIVTDRARPSNLWTRATYMEGLMALHQIAPESRYYEYAVRWGESHAWGLAYGSATDRNADDQACGQTYLDLYVIDPRPERIRDLKTAIDGMVNSTKSDDWWWIDALHMAMPLFARFGVMTNDPRYFARMYDLYAHTRLVEGTRGLYNPTEHLWWRDADFDPPYTEPNGANCYWSRGNGWVFAALVRVLDVLPENEAHRAEYVKTFQDMALALGPLQRADGFWNASLMDPANFGGRETTGTAMFTYGMAWGMRKGVLPRETYLPVVAKAWTALADSAVHADGFLGHVQGTGKQPSDSQPVTYDSEPNFDDFGTGAFLLAGAEVYRLATTAAVDEVSLVRRVDYLQVDATTVQLSTATPYRTECRITGTGLGVAPATSAVLTLPDGQTTRILTAGASGNDLAWEQSAGTAEAARVITPDGSYQLLLPNASGSLTLALGGGGDAGLGSFPEVPRVVASTGTWSGGRLAINAAQAVSLSIESATSGAGGDVYARLTVDGPGFHQGAGWTVLTGSAPRLTVAIEPFALRAGSPYTVTATFERPSTAGGSVRGTVSGTSVETALRKSVTFQLAPTEPPLARRKLVNLSTRGIVAPGSDLIMGFVVSPGSPKTVLVRAVGPTLATFGVPSPFANPTLRVLNANRTRAWLNDDWQSSSQSFVYTSTGTTALQASAGNAVAMSTATAAVGAFDLPARSRDAAMVLVLPPGSYSAQVSAPSSGTAVSVLAEIYELPTTELSSQLANTSTRGLVRPGDPLIGGFVIQGGPRRVLLRAVGPTLAAFGFAPANVLADPKLQVFAANGTVVASNDDWSTNADLTGQVALRDRVGAFGLPANSKDAETVVTLDEGVYTFQITGPSSGTALLELYAEPPGL